MIRSWWFSLIIIMTPLICQENWPQWGGPNRNFVVDAPELTQKWPEDGPPLLWQRALGSGYSSMVAQDGVLYTMYHEGAEDIVVAMSAASGETRWEYRYHEPFKGDGYGPGPNASPLIIGDRLFTVSGGGKLHAFSRQNGDLLWSHDLVAQFGAILAWHGYSCSPVAFRELIILPVGGPSGNGAMAFHQKDGVIAWKAHDFLVSYAAPTLITVGGMPQVVFYMKNRLAGVNPFNGKMLWEIRHRKQPIHNVALTPLWGPDQVLWTSVRGMREGDGSRAFQLTADGERVNVSEIWWQPDLRVEPHANALRVDKVVYATLESGRRARLAAIDVKSGAILWEDQTVGSANLIYAGGQLIILDEKGQLAIATPSGSGADITSRTSVQTTRSWTPPILVDGRLYFRDMRRMLAFDLNNKRHKDM